jgi:hypothetical protein
VRRGHHEEKTGLVASFAVAAALSFQFGLSNAYAANRADCSQVMTELQGGKTVAEVAKDMMISKSSVRRCRKAAAKASGGMEAFAAIASPASMASPAMAPMGH